MTNTPSRRETMVGAAAAMAVTATAAPAEAAAQKHAASDRTLRRIAFGSCAHQAKEQPIWDTILASKPDLMIMLGDNIYGDTRDPQVMRDKYAMLAAKPGFKKVRDAIPMCATWDDHDFGEDDAGGDYPMKEESRRIFCDFWGEAADSVRRTRDGIYTSYMFGPRGKRVQVILPDLRFNRTPIRKMEWGDRDYRTWMLEQGKAGKPAPGPYDREPSLTATMLGEPQWAWLEGELKQPAELRIFGSSLQVLADFAGWEGWINYARDHQRLFAAIRAAKADGVVCISGDTHYGELSMLDLNTPYPIWDVTSSGLTEVWPVLPPNALRVGDAVRTNNFGLIDIDWRGGSTEINLKVCDISGEARIRQTVALKSLRVKD